MESMLVEAGVHAFPVHRALGDDLSRQVRLGPASAVEVSRGRPLGDPEAPRELLDPYLSDVI